LWSGHLRRACRKRRPGLVLAGGLVPEGLLALELKRTMDVPYLLHLEAPQIVSLREGRASREVEENVLREVVAGSNGIVVGSQACWFEAYRLGIYPHDLQKIPVGVDLERFHPGPGSEALSKRLRIGKGPVLFSVMGLAPIDEIDTLLTAFASVRAHRPDAVLVIVGRERDAEVEALAKKAGVGGALRFVRSVPDAEMPEMYRLADVFVLAGREDRPKGLVDGIQFAALEALASGVPVVGARTRTTEELIPDGEVGILVDPGSPPKLAGAISHVLDAAPSNELGGLARAHAEREWDARRAADRLREHLEVVYFRRLQRGDLAAARAAGESIALGARP
jgi:phosphatidylinositol alpha-1,6-mannosyltransferase